MKRSFITAVTLFFYLLVSAQTGKVGINTNIPQAMLHVKDSSVLFSGGLSIQPTHTHGNPPASGQGIRMMWYPDKAAFRAGYTNSNEWDKANTGSYSFASGHSTIASGAFSTAMGLGSVADGSASVALGSGADALSDFSVAIGVSARTTNSNTVSIGTTTRAAGQYATAMGAFTVSNSYNCFATGRYNDSVATNILSPFQWIDTDPLFIIGNGTAVNARHNAMTVLKNGNVGINTSSPDAALHVLVGTSPGGAFASNSTLILERDANSYIQFSTPSNSFAGILSGNTETNIRSGMYFDFDSSINFKTGGNFERLVIDNTGNVGVNSTAPLALLHMKAQEASYNMHIRLENISNADYGAILYDGSMKFRTFGSDDVYQWRTFDNDTRMQLDQSGNLDVDGVYSLSSDARLKKNISSLQNSLQKILSLGGYNYNWIDASKDKRLQTGILAQQVEAQMPELVKTDADGMKSVNYDGLIPYLIEAIKELKQENELLKKKLETVKN